MSVPRVLAVSYPECLFLDLTTQLADESRREKDLGKNLFLLFSSCGGACRRVVALDMSFEHKETQTPWCPSSCIRLLQKPCPRVDISFKIYPYLLRL